MINLKLNDNQYPNNGINHIRKVIKQDGIVFLIIMINDEFYLVDVPGYGYAKVDKPTQKKFGLMIEDYLKTRYNLKCVFMLIDFRHKPTKDDLMMYNYLRHYNIPVTIVATKVDKISKNKWV